jgi:hypothetical protein
VGSALNPVFVNQALGIITLIDFGSFSAPTITDIDGDKDYDVIVLNDMGNLTLFENVGTRTAPIFVQNASNVFSTVKLGNKSRMSLSAVDIDGDMDVDFVVGKLPEPMPMTGGYWGTFQYFENIGTKSTPKFKEMTGSSADPFSGIKWSSCCMRRSAKQAFVDFDRDGDVDLFITGGYGAIHYYENIGNVTHAMFEKVAQHPLVKFDLGGMIAFTLVDIDNDEDFDVVAANFRGPLFTVEPNSCYLAGTCNGRGECQYSNSGQGGSYCQCFAGVASGSQCEQCPAGKIEVLFKGGRALSNPQALECRSCGAGRWSNVSGNLNGTCDSCTPGRFSSIFGADSESLCLLCPRGFSSYTDTESESGAVICLDCNSGLYQNELGQVKCKSCVLGFYQDAIGHTTCFDCPKGYFNKAQESSGCNAVPPGFYHFNSTSKKCDPGHFCEGEAANQTACLPGFYAPKEGSIACIECAPGTYADTFATKTCKECDTDAYQPESNATKCIPVQKGDRKSVV